MKTPGLLLAATLALVVAACSSGAAPVGGSPAPDPTPVPTDPGGRDPGAGNGSQPGTGIDLPILPPGNPGAPDPGEPQLVQPVPGARMIRDANATALEAAVNGRRVAVKVAWWGGVEPCDVLAGVDVVREGQTITLTVQAGAGPAAGPDVACIEIAVLKATVVDLGELEPGTYTIRATGDAAPIEVVIS